MYLHLHQNTPRCTFQWSWKNKHWQHRSQVRSVKQLLSNSESLLCFYTRSVSWSTDYPVLHTQAVVSNDLDPASLHFSAHCQSRALLPHPAASWFSTIQRIESTPWTTTHSHTDTGFLSHPSISVNNFSEWVLPWHDLWVLKGCSNTKANKRGKVKALKVVGR